MCIQEKLKLGQIITLMGERITEYFREMTILMGKRITEYLIDLEKYLLALAFLPLYKNGRYNSFFNYIESNFFMQSYLIYK